MRGPWGPLGLMTRPEWAIAFLEELKVYNSLTSELTIQPRSYNRPSEVFALGSLHRLNHFSRTAAQHLLHLSSNVSANTRTRSRSKTLESWK